MLFGRSFDDLHELKDAWFYFRGVFHREFFHNPEFAFLVLLVTGDVDMALSSLVHDMVDEIVTKRKAGIPLSPEEVLFLYSLGLADEDLSKIAIVLLLGERGDGGKGYPGGHSGAKRPKGKKAKHKDIWDDH